MFEGVVAGALNRWLGKYIADLDTERLNVGIFSGRVSLADLRLKPEALYELGLPIEVKTGSVGKLELVIPWGGLRAQPVVVTAEDVLVLAGPADGRDAERERQLLRAARRSLLEALEAALQGGARRRLDDLLAALLHNVHVCVRNVHVRYEDATSCRDGPFAAGFCLQSLSIETTNSKWKPCGSNGNTGASGGSGGSVYQMVRVEAVSAYWNARASVLDERETQHMTPIQYYNWKHHMLSGLRTFAVHGEPFHFLLRPVSCKVKVIVKGCGGGGGGGGGGDARAPLLLLDAVLQDGGVQLHRAQLLSIRSLLRAFRRIHIARKYRALRPTAALAAAPDAGERSARAWWMYAYRATVEQRVRPYTWAGVKRHRNIYNRYKQVYKAVLRSPADTELRLDLHKCEDDLPILSAVVAREHAKMELAAEEPSRVEVVVGCGEAGSGAELRVRGMRALTSLWTQLSSPEKATPPEQTTAPAPPRTKHYIEHKVNVTLGNWSLVLNRGCGDTVGGAGGGAGGGEVLVLTLSHFVASLETRPAPGAYKISARVENVTVEGAGNEGELMPLMWADPASAAAPSAPAPPANLLSLDWERRPPSGEADYALVAALEPIEIIYNQHAVSELLRFVESRNTGGAQTAAAARDRARAALAAAAVAARRALRRTKLLSLNLELKGVCLVLPEHGNIHKCGSVLVVEAERVSVRSELQPSSPALEDATCMELEERLYDRLHADCPALQVLFSEEGERWRELRKLPDSELHLLPRMKLQLVFSNTIVPTYVSLPRYKLNVTVSSLKLNLSERSAMRLAEFAEHLPAPLASDLTADSNYKPSAPPHLLHLFQHDRVQPDPGLDVLLCVRTHLVAAYISRTRDASEGAALVGKSGEGAEEVAPARSASEPSDEEAEVFARTVDLPGFDDNVSPTNTIRVLLRFVIGEVVVSLSRCMPPDTSERSYAMAAVSGVCVDAALMEYGPAVQLSIRSLLLSDKLHRAAAGQYLHLLSTGEDEDFLTLLYRKVRADCPDFKSHFHSVEQSLVADVGTLHIGVHAEALNHVYNYTLHLYHILRRPRVVCAVAAAMVRWWGAVRENAGREGDPPVPSGAVKFSYSTRVTCVSARLYHLDSEVLEARARGLESDCVFKANDRLIFKLFLGTLQVDHLADLTLYPKLVWGGEDKVLEVKYVRHSPRVYTPRPGGAAAALDDSGGGGGGGGGGGEADGSLRFYLGRVHILILYKLLLDIQNIWRNMSSSGLARRAVEAANRHARDAWTRGRDARLALAIDVRAPTLLMPRGQASPDLLVLNCGDLVVENFFKAVCVGSTGAGVVDNMLLRLSNVTLARAVMTLAGALHLQEPILEPTEMRMDVKRRRRGAGCGEGVAPLEADATLDTVVVNLGRRDLAALLTLASDYSNLVMSLGWGRGRGETGAGGAANLEQDLDSNVEKLQAFFAKTEPIRKEISLRVCLEGAAMKLFSDAEEVLSSPVREATRGLARLALPELSLHLHTYSDTSLELRAALNSLTLQDMRPTPNIYFQRVPETGEEEGVDEQEGGSGTQDSDGISVWSPPLAELEWRRSSAGDHALHLQVERTRLYFSVPFFLHLARFFLDAMPGERTLDVTGGVVNHGYEGEAPGDNEQDGDIQLSLSPNSTSGCCSSGGWSAEESPGITVSVRFRRPELVLPANGAGYALLFRAELLLDYSRHAAVAAGETLTVSLSGLEAAWKAPCSLRTVLQSCDVELSRSCRSDEGVRAALILSPIDVSLSPPVLHTLTGILEEVRGETSVQEHTPPPLERGEVREEDLWSPRKLASLDVECGECDERSPHDLVAAVSAAVPETFVFNAPQVRVTLQFQPHGGSGAISVESSLEGTVWEWSGRPHGGATLALHASVYNERADVWEPLLEPACRPDGSRTPWRVHCHFFQAKSYPMCSDSEDVTPQRVSRPAEKTRGLSTAGARRPGRRKRCSAGSGTSADETESDGEMSFVRSRPLGEERQGAGGAPPLPPRPTLSALPIDESDDDDANSQRTAAATRLFADESSGEDSSEAGQSSSAERSEPEAELESAEEGRGEEEQEPVRNANPIQEQAESLDSGLVEESWREEKNATYVVVHARNTLDLTLTPHAVQVCSQLVAAITDRATDMHIALPLSTSMHIELVNDIGPDAKVQLVNSAERDLAGRERVLAAAEWDVDADTSRASSPSADNLDAAVHTDTTRHWHWPESVTAPNRATAAADTEDSAGAESEKKPTRALYEEMPPERVVLHVLEREELRVVCPRRDVSLLLPLSHRTQSQVRYHVRLERSTYAGSRVLLVRSPLQIRNETSYPLELLYRKTDLETLGLATPGELTNPFDDKLRLTVIEPDHTYNLPLHVAYHCPLFLLPTSLESYRPAARGIWWRELATEPEIARDFVCQAKADGDSSVFAIRVLIVPGAGVEEMDAETPDCVIRVLPPLVLHNRLPYALQLHLPHLDYRVRLEPGEKTRTHLVDFTRPHTICMEMNYRSVLWSGELTLSGEWRERRVRMRGEGGGGERPAICSRLECSESWELYLHSPYWIINKTGLPLHMKVSRCDSMYEVGDEPLLFGAEWRGSGAAAARRTVRLRAHLSAWSRAFSLDAVGAPGLVVCHHRERRRKYRILLETRLSEVCPWLTRTVTLLPYYTIHNDTRRHLRYMEENEAADLWLELSPGQCAAFWPETDAMRLHCKLRDSPALSQHFPLAVQHFTVLRMDKGSALSVEVTGGEFAPWNVRFRPYREGDAPVRVDNLTSDLFIKLHQRDSSQVVLLNPQHSCLYTWDDPCADRILLCNVYNSKTDSFPVHIQDDGYGEEKVNLHSVKHSPLAQTNSMTSKLSSTLKMFTPRARSPDPPSSSASGDDSDTESTMRAAPRIQRDSLTLHWVSYREGLQRVLVLTDKERIAHHLRTRLAFTERSNSELYISLGGLGLSLCSDHRRGVRELAYLSLSGSVPRWEANLSRRWRLLAPDLTASIEERYMAGGADGEIRIRDYVHADLERMHMTKPFFSELRRTSSPALWLQLRRSATLVHLRARIHRLQLDDQRPVAVFPCVLYPAPTDSVRPVPCARLSIRCRRNSACYERVDVNVQPCCVNLELGFVRCVLRLADVWRGQVRPAPAVRLRADLALVHAPLVSLVCLSATTAGDAPFFRRVRLSPLSCTLSLSRGESAELVARSEWQGSRYTQSTFNSDLTDYMLHSWSATLSNVKGIKLKAPALEMRDARGWRRVAYVTRRHYTTRVLEQFHASVLHLDVLTNRLATSRSLEGEDVCGVTGEQTEWEMETRDLARKLEYGVSVLLGECASGAPRAAPLLADCPPAAATLMRRTRLTTTLTMAAWCATGRSAEAGRAWGAEEPPSSPQPPHPAEIALALLGLVARPTLDVYREAARECGAATWRGGGAAEWALRSAAERSGGRLVARRRLPRHSSLHQGVEVYSAHSALGEVLLHSTRAHADRTDAYFAHATLAPPLAPHASDMRRAIIITTRRVLCLRTGSGCGGGMGGWWAEWSTPLERLTGVPVLCDNKLVFTIQQQERGGYGEEGWGGEERAVESGERETLLWLRARIRAALLLQLEQQRIPTPL